MLHWRRKSALKRHKLWAKLVACSFGMHLIFLVLLFVGYRDTIKLTFSMSANAAPKHNAPVKLVSLKPPAPKGQIVQGWQNKKPAVQKRTVAKKPIIKKPTVAKAMAGRPVTKVAAAKKTPIKKPAPKKVVQAKPAVAKAMADRPKSAPQKKLAAAKPVPKKQAVALNKQVEKQEIQSITPALDQSIQLDTTQVDQNNDLSAVALAQADEQFAKLHQELARHWQPPVGIAQECACEITAHVDRQGKIENIEIDTPSGVLMFDVAARTAMLAMELPKWTWGKSLSITFKP